MIGRININNNSLINSLMQVMRRRGHNTLMATYLPVSNHSSRHHPCHKPTLHCSWHSSGRMLYTGCFLIDLIL